MVSAAQPVVIVAIGSVAALVLAKRATLTLTEMDADAKPVNDSTNVVEQAAMVATANATVTLD